MLDARNTRVLICDDEPRLREMVAEYLSERGYDVLEAGKVQELGRVRDADSPHLILLDINMPGGDGLTALREMRVHSDVPVIMLTAAGDVVDRIIGLEMGADDYLGKPVDLRELEARIRAALRRQSGSPSVAAQPGQPPAPGPFGSCNLGLRGARLFGKEGQEIPITAMEFDLLKLFYEHAGQVLSREQILDQAHKNGWAPFDWSIDLRVSRLRRKVEANPSKPQAIRTVRGIGYLFEK